jgi:hypothetical protein
MAKKITTTKAKKPTKNGRPTEYNKKYNDTVKGLCLLGATDAQIADCLNVSEKTLNRWKKRYPEFCQSLKDGKVKADTDVATSLYQKAITGDVTAQIFWLKNRQPKTWRDKQTQVIENPDGTPIFHGFNFLPYTPIDDKES